MITDSTIMIFGKYKGKKLEEIPASYFLWLKDQSWFITNSKNKDLLNYINENEDAFEHEIKTHKAVERESKYKRGW